MSAKRKETGERSLIVRATGTILVPVKLSESTGDPQDMAAKTLELMDRAEKGDLGLRMSHLVIAEVVWVLSSFYGHTRHQIDETLNSFLEADGIFVEDHDLLIQSLHDMAEKNVDFIDAYLAAMARSQEESICSFDNDFDKLNVQWVRPPGDRLPSGGNADSG